jgi:SulP family sulfate permease
MGIRIVPDWISGYQRKWLPTDVIAGLTVAAILVPEGMA